MAKAATRCLGRRCSALACKDDAASSSLPEPARSRGEKRFSDAKSGADISNRRLHLDQSCVIGSSLSIVWGTADHATMPALYPPRRTRFWAAGKIFWQMPVACHQRVNRSVSRRWPMSEGSESGSSRLERRMSKSRSIKVRDRSEMLTSFRQRFRSYTDFG